MQTGMQTKRQAETEPAANTHNRLGDVCGEEPGARHTRHNTGPQKASGVERAAAEIEM